MKLLHWLPHRHRWVNCVCHWCGRDNHELDERCCCLNCGEICHAFTLKTEWIEEEGIDAETGWPWMAYDHVEIEVEHCWRCGKEGKRRRTGYLKGPG